MDRQYEVYAGPFLKDVLALIRKGDRVEAARLMRLDFTSDFGDCHHDPDPDTLWPCDIEGSKWVRFEDTWTIQDRKARQLRGQYGDGI